MNVISFIIQAAENFCIHQIRVPYAVEQISSEMRTLIAYIDIKNRNEDVFRIYLGCDDVLIQHITKIFLGEELSDKELLKDMLLETTNMIVGSAKVISEEYPLSSFTISTPHLYNSNQLSLTTDKSYTFNLENGEMIIAIKAL